MSSKKEYKEKKTQENLSEALDHASLKFSSEQLMLKEKKLPVIILVEGYSAAGKGTAIKKMIKDMDPRFFTVLSSGIQTKAERKMPFLWKYFNEIPENGTILILDSAWMSEITRQYMKKEISRNDYLDAIEDIKNFERTLTDNGYLVLKYFLNISKSEQESRLAKLEKDKDTRWRVSKFDKWENAHYKEASAVYEEYMELTNTALSPWTVIDSSRKQEYCANILTDITERIEQTLKTPLPQSDIKDQIFPVVSCPLLKDIPLDYDLDEETYKKQYEELQKTLSDLHNRLYRKKVPVVIMYEGWDAAGKGGNIKRISSGLDPRGYEVYPIASPSPEEKNRHFLWRFYKRLPKKGHISIFDRSWYGRVMVERLEGFCSEEDWKRAYNEINEFEQYLTKNGAIVIKFWVQIDKDTQLARFNDRKNTPEKQWKITDEDWRNREKWDQYEEAINEMIAKTNTDYAPWHILESNNKLYARIKAMNIVIEQLKKALS